MVEWVWRRRERLRRHIEKAGGQLIASAYWPLPSQATRWVFLASVVALEDDVRLEQLRLLTRNSTFLLVSRPALPGTHEERLKALLEAAKPLGDLAAEPFIRFPSLPSE